MQVFFALVLGFLLASAVVAGVAAVVAFPFMWGWNYAITHVFGAPDIGWGHAFVLLFFLMTIKPSMSVAAKD